MSRYREIKSAVTEVLGKLGTEVTELYPVGVPLVTRGFSEEEIVNVLISLDRNKVIELLPDNQLRVLSEPNEQRGFEAMGARV